MERQSLPVLIRMGDHPGVFFIVTRTRVVRTTVSLRKASGKGQKVENGNGVFFGGAVVPQIVYRARRLDVSL